MPDYSIPTTTEPTTEYELLSRADAIAQGSTTYFTGKPCPHGHIDLRFVASYGCRECMRLGSKKAYDRDPARHSERARVYNAANRKRVSETQRKWREHNRDHVRQVAQAWRERNRASLSERERRRRAKNPESARESERAWRKRNVERARANERRWRARNPIKVHVMKINAKAKARGAHGVVTEEEWADLLEKSGKRCLACGNADEPLTADHIVPIANGGVNTIGNLQPLCGPCNNKKRNRSIDYRTWLHVGSKPRKRRT